MEKIKYLDVKTCSGIFPTQLSNTLTERDLDLDFLLLCFFVFFFRGCLEGWEQASSTATIYSLNNRILSDSRVMHSNAATFSKRDRIWKQMHHTQSKLVKFQRDGQFLLPLQNALFCFHLVQGYCTSTAPICYWVTVSCKLPTTAQFEAKMVVSFYHVASQVRVQTQDH